MSYWAFIVKSKWRLFLRYLNVNNAVWVLSAFQVIEELEYNSPDRKNVPKNQVKIGLFTLLGLRSLFRKREKEPVRESRKYYDDLTYDQESGTYIEDE